MAREISLGAPSGNTRYCIIRRPSDVLVWNGSTFATWADANIGTYDIPLTDNGGDFYTADFPTDITQGNYYVIFYLQAGASPATNDVIGDSILQYWTGSALISGAGSSTGGCFITPERAVLEPELSAVSVDDPRLFQIITVACEHVKWYLQRYYTDDEAANASDTIQYATARVAAQIYVRSQLDNQYDSESLADYSYSRTKADGSNSFITAMVRDLLWQEAAHDGVFVPDPADLPSRLRS
jgi:hypothetical protein